MRVLAVSTALAAVLASPQAWAQGTTPGVEPSVGWRDAITLGIAVLGALLGFLNIWIGIWRDRRKKSADSTYLAMRLAVILEGYADACADLISDNNKAEHHVAAYLPDWNTSLPRLAEFPEDGDGWKALDPNVAGECLGFQNKINGSQGLISEIVEYDDHGIGRAVEMQASERGVEAWSLAVKLRKAHDLRPVDLVFRYDEYLQRVHREALAREEERDRRATDRLNKQAEKSDATT